MLSLNQNRLHTSDRLNLSWGRMNHGICSLAQQGFKLLHKDKTHCWAKLPQLQEIQEALMLVVLQMQLAPEGVIRLGGCRETHTHTLLHKCVCPASKRHWEAS